MEDSVRISVIIVNYNVEYFLEQCLNAVFKSLNGINGEVFVVDNNSIDGSVEMVQHHYPSVKLITNKENVGFSKANNQAIRQSKGDYVLLLNPDTVVEEDTFSKCISFMDNHPDGGGLGVRMIDGKGKFLPESKRGLPTPAVAFYKIFGLARLFPKSKKFGRYHLGYLSEFETHKIEILSGAFMLMRKKALDKVGILDENFFMYGEDIDLSYRITQGGYKNYYFPETQIIHYKGESTKKSSINYVFVFYRAMVIFAEKHFTKKRADLFSFFINLAIYLRAGIAVLNRFIRRITLPTVDFIFIVGGLYALTLIWLEYSINFPENILSIFVPSYALIWLISNIYSSSYDPPIRFKSFAKGALIGTGLILIIYSLLPLEYRFSRLFIFAGAITTFVYYLLSRVILHFAIGNRFDLQGIKNKNFVIVGEADEIVRVTQIVKNTPHKVNNIYTVSPTKEKDKNNVGIITQLGQIIDNYEIDEVIFCAKNTSAEEIIKWMSKTATNNVEFKIAQPNSMYLIGSNSVDTSGDLYMMQIDRISTYSSKRNKRTFDLISSIFLLIISPILCWFYKHPKRFIINAWSVFIGKKSWVGYSKIQETQLNRLPQIKTGILSPSEGASKSLQSKLNLIYARDYSIFKDISIIRKYWYNLDR